MNITINKPQKNHGEHLKQLAQIPFILPKICLAPESKERLKEKFWSLKMNSDLCPARSQCCLWEMQLLSYRVRQIYLQ